MGAPVTASVGTGGELQYPIQYSVENYICLHVLKVYAPIVQ